MSTANQCDGAVDTNPTPSGETGPKELSSGDLFSKGLYSVTYTITDAAGNERVHVFSIQVCEGIAICLYLLFFISEFGSAFILTD